MIIEKKQLLVTCGLFAVLILNFPFDSFSQDSVKTEKILLVERKTLKNWQTKPTQRIFHTGKKVAIKRYSNDSLLRGHIESIMDSSIIIKGETVPLKDIRRISVIRGETISWVGAAASALSLGVFAGGYIVINSVEYRGLGAIVFGVLGSFCAVPVLIFGIIDRVTAKHYHLDKDFVIMVKTVEYKE